jgi:diadenosine tetraphosphate (Ap4A) HIT family hydrolase
VREPCPLCETVATGTWTDVTEEGPRTRSSAVVEETATTVAFVRESATPGYLLVIPKKHVETILDLTDDEASALMLHVVRLARAIEQAFKPDGINIFQNNGVVAFQTVPHVHIHLLPRFLDDGWVPPPGGEEIRVPFEDMERTAAAVRKELALPSRATS